MVFKKSRNLLKYNEMTQGRMCHNLLTTPNLFCYPNVLCLWKLCVRLMIVTICETIVTISGSTPWRTWHLDATDLIPDILTQLSWWGGHLDAEDTLAPTISTDNLTSKKLKFIFSLFFVYFFSVMQFFTVWYWFTVKQ